MSGQGTILLWGKHTLTLTWKGGRRSGLRGSQKLMHGQLPELLLRTRGRIGARGLMVGRLAEPMGGQWASLAAAAAHRPQPTDKRGGK